MTNLTVEEKRKVYPARVYGATECSECGASKISARGLCNRCYKRARAAGAFIPATWDLTARLDAGYEVDSASGCWLWTRTTQAEGYGHISSGGRTRLVHRLMYERYVGPIPSGLHLDHLCRTPACCNPDHLEAVTPGENIRRSPIAVTAVNGRKTHCPAGHPYSDENTRRLRNGGRACRACWRRLAPDAVFCQRCNARIVRSPRGGWKHVANRFTRGQHCGQTPLVGEAS